MAGISSSALGKLTNRIRFNGYEQQSREFSDGSGLEWYDYKNRFYDNQVGRFFCVDRLADKFPYYTPYQFAGNEVPNAIDLDGLEPLRYGTPQGILSRGLGDLTQALGKMVDRLGLGGSASHERTEPSSVKDVSNVNGVEAKASLGTNVSGFIDYVKYNGAADGFKDKILTADFSLKAYSGVKTEVKAAGAETSTTNLNDGTKKTEFQVTNPVNPATDLTLTTSSGPNGNTVGSEISNKGPVKGKVGIEHNTTNSKTSVQAAVEVKTKNTTTKLSLEYSF